jgi:glutamine cyclotransferase
MAASAKRNWVLAVVVALAAAGIVAWAQYDSQRGPDTWTVRSAAAFPHDPEAFTQGLTIHDGLLYESTGQYGRSTLRRVDMRTGVVEQMTRLNRALFGEGIAVVGDQIYQLTWQNEVGAIFERESFELVRTFEYSGEGWGLTYDGTHLIMSDGSASLDFLNVDTFDVERSVVVHDGETQIDRVNELEYIDGEIWANIWYEDRIARVSPGDGELLGWIDISNLYPADRRGREDVANGIAYDADAERIFVTGKLWPQLFEIEIER